MAAERERSERGRTFSRALMGARYRLEVAVAIARGTSPFWASRLASELGLPLHYVTKEVHALEAAGLVESINTPGDRRRFYRRVESSFWSSVTELAFELGEPKSAVAERIGRRPTR
jgi:predicted transcriptional regulator